jgi:hypothetical protein
MLADIFEMLTKAAATSSSHSLRVALNFGDLAAPLIATLEDFRDWEHEFRVVRRRTIASSWTADALWALRRAFEIEGASRVELDRDLGAWQSQYYRGQLVLPPSIEKTGNPKFDEVVQQSQNLIRMFIETCLSLAPDHQSLGELWRRSRSTAERGSFSDEQLAELAVVGGPESDFWPVGLLSMIESSRRHVERLQPVERAIACDQIAAAVDQVHDGLEKSEFEVDSLEEHLSEILKLPVWKRRHEVYSVWVASQIIASLETREIRFHPIDGQLDFGFGGAHLATILTDDGVFALWSEFRSALRRPGSRTRTKFIQPDFRLLRAPFKSDGSTTALVVECKQYMKPSAKNFSEALNDYAASCPDAEVMLVNYGRISDGIRECIIPDVIERTHLIGDFRPQEHKATSDFKLIVNEAVSDEIRRPHEVSLGPILKGTGRIDLVWGAPFHDLDLHLIVHADPNPNHISFSDMRTRSGDAYLTNDARDAPGIETIHITSWRNADYEVFVHNYSGLPPLTGSDATVSVTFEGANMSFRPPSEGKGLWWHVCTLKPSGRALISRNSISDVAPDSMIC